MRYSVIMLFSLSLGACMNTTAPAPNPPKASVVQEDVQLAAQPETPILPKPKAEHTSLMGLNPRSVQAMVGEPTLVRRDENVQAMLYETPACVLEIIFYEPDPQASFEVRHISARQRNGDDIDMHKCLEAVLPDGYWLENNDAIIE